MKPRVTGIESHPVGIPVVATSGRLYSGRSSPGGDPRPPMPLSWAGELTRWASACYTGGLPPPLSPFVSLANGAKLLIDAIAW
jgi:hypothetical protein